MTLIPGARESREILESVGRILLTEKDWLAAACVLAQFQDQSPSLFAAARANKVLTILHNTLSQLSRKVPGSVNPALLTESQTLARKGLELRDRAHGEMLRLVTLMRHELQIDPLLLKGYSVARLYPAPYQRWMHDIDLFVPDATSAFKIYEMMCDQGYTLHPYEIPWFKQGELGELYGHIVLQKNFGEHKIGFDIHFAKFSMAYSGFLLSNPGKNSIRVSADGIELYVPNPSQCLLLVFAHMLSDGYVRMKDINDLVVLLLNAELDWQEVAETIKRNHLEGIAHNVIRKIQNLYDHPVIQEQAGRGLGQLSRPRFFGSLPYYKQNRTWRALVNSAYTFQFERQFQRLGFLASMRCAVEGFLYYLWRYEKCFRPRRWSEKLRLRFLSKPNLRTGQVNSRTCVRLVEFQRCSDWAREASLQTPSRVYCPEYLVYLENSKIGMFLTNRHIFFPTIDYIIEPAQVTWAHDLMQPLMSRKDSQI